MFRLYCLLIGYAFGLIQTAYIYGRLKGIDIRKVGSGNAGSTNTLRVFGTKAGFIVLFGDILKTMAAIWLVRLTFGRVYPDIICLLIFYTAFGVILGHNFPFYLGFKGGKGIAATAGFMLSMNTPWLFCTMFPWFVLVFLTTHYISLGSTTVYLVFFIETIVLGQCGKLGALSQPQLIEIYCLAFALMCLALWQHRSNIVKLFKGIENKTYLSKKGKEKYMKSDAAVKAASANLE